MKLVLMLLISINTLFGAINFYNNIEKIDDFKLGYYYDSSGKANIEQIVTKKFDKEIQNQFSLGYLFGSSWFTFDIQNNSDNNELVFYFTEAFFQELHLYEKVNNHWIKHAGGLDVSLINRDLRDRNTAIILNIKKGETKRYYIQTSTKFAHFGEFQIHDMKLFLTKYKPNILMMYMLYFGVIIMIIVFNTFLYFTLKDKIYAYYVGYAFFYMIFIFVLSGFNIFIGLHHWYYELHLSAPLLMVFLILFSNTFLELKEYMQKTFILSNTLGGVFLLLAILILVDLERWYWLLTTFASITFLVLIYASIIVWRLGHKKAKYYVFALTIYMVTMVLFTSMVNGWLEYNDINRYLFLFASLLEIMIFSLVLASRFLDIKNEKIDMQYKLIETLKETQEKEKLLQQQSKLAQMGEMISMIAHQWRQPLGSISSTVMGMQVGVLSGEFDLDDKKDQEKFTKFLDEKCNKISQYVQFLSTTIDDFRNFFKPDKKKEKVNITIPINKALQIIQISTENKGIKIDIDYQINDEIEIYQNEMIQVILNILKNSEDNFEEKKRINPMIQIKTFKKEKSCFIQISDNGGGIPPQIMQKIFNPYFSTKDKKNGTGLGLYMSKVMTEEHNNGKLNVKNIKNGVCFEILFNERNHNEDQI